MNRILKLNSDMLGVSASAICLVHCIATPFIFVAQAGLHGHHGHSSPFWLDVIDTVFLIISLLAVLWSMNHTTKNWVKTALFTSWLALGFIIANEKYGNLAIPEYYIYFPAISLIVLHLYNHRFGHRKMYS